MTPPAPLEIEINGERVATRAATLAALLDERDFAGVRVATAINGTFVPERARASQAIAAGDRIEILSARQGG